MIDMAELGVVLAETSKINQGHYLYNWSGIFEDRSVIDIEKVYIRNVGAVDIPVSPESILAIEEEYSKLSPQEDSTDKLETPSDSCQVESSEIFIIPGNKRKLSEMLCSLSSDVLARMLDIDICNLTHNVKATLDHLVICRAGQSFSLSMNNRKEPGMFGVMVLQVPVKTDHPSGQLVVKDAAQKTEVDFQENNQNSFLVAAVAGTSQDDDRSRDLAVFSSYPLGIILLLVFNLGWKDCHSPVEEWMCNFFPKYLSVSDKLSKSLHSWSELRGASSSNPSPVNALCYRQGTNITGNDQPSFLCFPLTNSYGPEPTLWSLTGQDLLTLKILDMVNFIDVNFAIVKRRTHTTSNSGDIVSTGGSKSSMEKQALFIFQKGHFRSNSIKDGLFNSTFYLKKHLIPTSSFGEESEAADTISVLVIRPRSLNFRILKKLSLEDLQPEIFLSNLEERVQNLLDDPGSSENSPGHISRDLELILDALPDFDGGCQKELITDETAQIEEYESSPIKCMKCLLYRLLIVCTQLKNTGQGLRVLLHISKLKDQAIFRRCQTCGVNLNHPNPAIIFANFICLASGCDIPLKLMLRKLDLSTYVDFCHLGVKLSHGGCTAGAREIFYHVCYHLENDALLRFETDEVCFDVQLFDLAVELHAKDNDDLAIQRVYRLSRMTCSSNLMNLIDHLVERAKTGKLDIACYLRGLGDIVVEKIISANSFDHLLKALKIFHQFHEEQTLLLIWTSICSQCIEEYNLESGDNISLKSRCLFCRLLSTSDDEGNDLMASMAIARNAQDALGCSIDKLTEINSGSSFHYKEVLSFIRRVIKLQEILPVYFHTERIENFCSLFTCIHSEDMCDLVHSILGPKRYLRRNGSVTSLLVERLILQLLNRKEDFLSSTSMEYVSMALEFCVWYGDLNLLKNLLKKLDVRFSASVHSETTKSFATLIATILKEKVAEDASSAINREVFCLLIWKWALLLRNLKNGKIPSFLDCFQTTFKLEKKLENFHKPENLTLEFSQTISYFDFNENLEILKSIFTSEYGDDIDLSLKTLPTSLKIFSTLCNTLSNMIDVEKASHLTVDSLVILMQCFLWLGEEKPIVDFARFLVNLPRSEFSGDALEAIIFEENTADLAAGSPFGVVALGDLIDCRIHQLSPPRAAKDILSRLCPRLLGRSNSNNGRSKRSNSCAELQPEKANERLSKDGKGSRAKVEQLQQFKDKFLKGLNRN